MMRSRFLLAVLGLLVCVTAAAAQEPEPKLFFIDPTHSTIQFSVPFMGITRVPGNFNQFYGRVIENAGDPTTSSARVVIRAASIDTRNARRDDDLRGEKYFEVDRFPEIVFQARGVDTTSDPWVLKGTLRMHGVQLERDVPFEFLGRADTPEGEEMGIAARLVLDRTDYGLVRGRFSGDRAFVGTEVTIDILLRLREVSPAKAEMMRMDGERDLPESDLERLPGTYVAGPDDGGFSLEILELDDELVVDRAGTLYRLVPTADGGFRMDDFAARLRFEEIGGAVRSLVFERQGREPVSYARR